MTEKIDKVYGPHTLECSRFGKLTRFLIRFLPTYIYETPEGVVVYKKWRGTMYVLGVMRKENRVDEAGWN